MTFSVLRPKQAFIRGLVCLLLALSAFTTSPSLYAGPPTADLPTGEINGAIYIPTKAWNFAQMYLEYNSGVTARDFGYAKRINLNALRIFGSHFAYAQNRANYQAVVEDLLNQASAGGMRVLFVLYENCGEEFDSETLRSLRDPLRAVAAQDPDRSVTDDPSKWEPYREHVRWFMANYRNDPRLLGIEVINEPHANARPFAHEMVRLAVANKGSVPLSVGTLPEEHLGYVQDGVDVIQFHNNFPTSLEDSRQFIEHALSQARSVGRPLWMTEWQRIRPSGPNWGGNGAVPDAERYTDLASMARQVKQYRNQVGAFFWSLMVKPAYLEGQRKAGTVNGLFWEDGAVWDLEGARIIADNPQLNLPVRTRVPFETLRFEDKENRRWLQVTDIPDSSGLGFNVQSVQNTFTGNKTRWRIIRIAGDEYFRLESVHNGMWLQDAAIPDATEGRPSADLDSGTTAVRAVGRNYTGDYTRWRIVKSGQGDYRFRLQNKGSGRFLQMTNLQDVDGQGFDGGTQVRAVPSTKTGNWTSFKSIDASF